MNLRNGLAMGAALMALSGLDMQEAHACDPALEYVVDALPAEDAVVAPDAQLLIFFNGAQDDPTIELVDEAGEPVAVSVERMSQAAFFGFVRELLPQAPLAEGTYSMRVTYGNEYQDDFERSFEVDADHAWAPVEGAPELTWYRETYAEGTGNSCEWGDAYQMIRFGAVPGAVSYYVELQRGDTVLEQRYLSDKVDAFHGFVMEGVECVRVAALSGDGGPGESTELCVPDKCNHFEGEMPWQFGTTDWDEVDGCETEVPVEGDPDDSDAGSDDVGAGDVGSGSDAGSDAGGWDVEEPIERQEGAEFGCGGCSSTESSSSTALAMLLAMLGAAAWRRRRFAA